MSKFRPVGQDEIRAFRMSDEGLSRYLLEELAKFAVNWGRCKNRFHMAEVAFGIDEEKGPHALIMLFTKKNLHAKKIDPASVLASVAPNAHEKKHKYYTNDEASLLVGEPCGPLEQKTFYTNYPGRKAKKLKNNRILFLRLESEDILSVLKQSVAANAEAFCSAKAKTVKACAVSIFREGKMILAGAFESAASKSEPLALSPDNIGKLPLCEPGRTESYGRGEFEALLKDEEA